MSPRPLVRPEGLRIRELVERTGVSRELIHHYLREGLLPACRVRARYDERQLRLLTLVRRLREELHLPLDTIRRVFERYRHDPDWLEPLFHAESLAVRLTRFAEDADLGLGRTLDAAELADAAGVDRARLETYLAESVVLPLAGTSPPRFSPFDAHVIALCEQGTELGIPFTSFRTVAAYVRVGFELEHREFLDVDWSGAGDPERLLGQAFARREITSSFVHNVLHALIQRQLHGRLSLTGVPAGALRDVVFQPSAAFRARHALQAAVDARRQALVDAPEDVDGWLGVARLLLHAGSYREAAFTIQQLREQRPDDAELRAVQGIALVLAGDTGEGAAALEAARGLGASSAESAVYLALALYQRAAEGEDAADAGRIRALATAALDERGAPTAADAHVGYLAAWLLTALPPAFADLPRGHAALRAAADASYPAAPDGTPGLGERHRLNAAWLLFELLGREPALGGDDGEGTRDALRARVCQLDPACRLAERAFLDER